MPEQEFLSSLELFFSNFSLQNYRKRNMISSVTDFPPSVFFLKEGYIRVYRVSEEGEELTLIILKPGDLFPMIWGVDDLPNNYYLETLTPVEILRVSREQFLKFLGTHPDITYELTNRALVKFGGLLTRMEYLIFGNAYTKVAATLFVCARRFGVKKGNDILVDLPLTHKDIATLVGLTRETTCLEMKKLEKKGLVYHQGKSFVIKDVKKLEDESLISTEQGYLLNNSL